MSTAFQSQEGQRYPARAISQGLHDQMFHFRGALPVRPLSHPCDSLATRCTRLTTLLVVAELPAGGSISFNLSYKMCVEPCGLIASDRRRSEQSGST